MKLARVSKYTATASEKGSARCSASSVATFLRANTFDGSEAVPLNRLSAGATPACKRSLIGSHNEFSCIRRSLNVKPCVVRLAVSGSPPHGSLRSTPAAIMPAIEGGGMPAPHVNSKRYVDF